MKSPTPLLDAILKGEKAREFAQLYSLGHDSLAEILMEVVDSLEWFANPDMYKTFMAGGVEMEKPILVNGETRARQALDRVYQLLEVKNEWR